VVADLFISTAASRNKAVIQYSLTNDGKVDFSRKKTKHLMTDLG
jgi:hypothetical protein